LVLVWVWYVTEKPRYFVFSSCKQVERFLRTGARSATWLSNKQYNVSRPTRRLSDLAEHEDRWDRVMEKLGVELSDTSSAKIRVLGRSRLPRRSLRSKTTPAAKSAMRKRSKCRSLDQK
jgi:hypothetical protein